MRLSLSLCIPLTACASLAACAPRVDEDPPPAPDEAVVETSYGALRGTPDGDSLAFLGVPFAAPPVRWRAPEPPAPWDGVREAATFAEPCTQTLGSTPEEASQVEGSEDCLYLNVWRPADAPAEGALPVVVYVHGGGNTYGGATEPLSSLVYTDPGQEDRPLYGGARLAAEGDVVVVTLQYRLGALGYLSHPALDADGPDGTSGNYGLLDIIAALDWVRDEIGAFGGDPDRVLLAGQSGGGRDVNALWTCNTPPGLFSAAAIHSAPLGLDDPTALRARAGDLIAEVGCSGAPEDVVSCMREVPAADLLTAQASQPLGLASGAFIPTVDGTLCTEQPRQAVRGGRAADIPVLLGTTNDEYSHRWSGIRAAAYPALVRNAVGARYADAVLEQYPLERFPSPTVAYTEMMSDRNVTCPHRRYARMAAASGHDVHHYRFRQVLPDPVRHGYGAYHTTDILYLFRHMDGEAFAVTPDDQATEDAMTRYWTRFAATGDPSGGDDPTWPTYSLEDERSLVLQATPTLEVDVKKEDCDFWDALLAR